MGTLGLIYPQMSSATKDIFVQSTRSSITTNFAFSPSAVFRRKPKVAAGIATSLKMLTSRHMYEWRLYFSVLTRVPCSRCDALPVLRFSSIRFNRSHFSRKLPRPLASETVKVSDKIRTDAKKPKQVTDLCEHTIFEVLCSFLIRFRPANDFFCSWMYISSSRIDNSLGAAI